MSKENESITFRINSKVIEQLRMQAEYDRISLNTFVNRILSGYLEWDIHTAARNFGVIQKSILKEMAQEISTEKLREIAQRATSIADLMLLTGHSQDAESLLHAVMTIARHSGYLVRSFRDDDRRWKIIIQHDLGPKWSEFYKAQIEQVFRNANHRITLENTDNSLIVIIDRA